MMMFLIYLLLIISTALAQQCFQATDGGPNGVLYNAVRNYVGGGTMAQQLYGNPINTWCVDAVTDMSFIFHDVANFNEPIGDWNVGNVVNMNGMFQGASSFDQPLGSWNVGSVTNMERMFFLASSFNQPLNAWDTSSVETTFQMFLQAESFDQPLNEWDLSSLSVLNGMFASADSFNQNLCAWASQLVPKRNSITFGGMFDEANCAVPGLPDLDAADPGPFCGSSCERDPLVACPININVLGFLGCLLNRVIEMIVDLFE